MCPSQTEGTYDEFHSGHSKSYLSLVTTLNAAEISLEPHHGVAASANVLKQQCSNVSKLQESKVNLPANQLLQLEIVKCFHSLSLSCQSFQTKLGPFMTNILTTSYLTSEPKLTRNRPLETGSTFKTGTFLILIISFDDYISSLQAPTCPVKATIRNVSHKVGDIPTAPRYVTVNLEAFLLLIDNHSRLPVATTRYLCIVLDSERLYFRPSGDDSFVFNVCKF